MLSEEFETFFSSSGTTLPKKAISLREVFLLFLVTTQGDPLRDPLSKRVRLGAHTIGMSSMIRVMVSAFGGTGREANDQHLPETLGPIASIPCLYENGYCVRQMAFWEGKDFCLISTIQDKKSGQNLNKKSQNLKKIDKFF